jgi:hypothetical protein
MSVKLWRRRPGTDPLSGVRDVSAEMAQMIRDVDGLLAAAQTGLGVTVDRLQQIADEACARAEESSGPDS